MDGEDLRTSAEESQLLIFELLVQLLRNEPTAEIVDKQCFHAYAAQFWAHHLAHIETTTQNAPRLLPELFLIFTDEDNVTASFESYKTPYYDEL